jgi:hypothetical protein
MIMRMTVIRGDLRLKAGSETRQTTDMLLIHNHTDRHTQKKPHSMSQTRRLRHGSLLPFSRRHNNVLSSAMKVEAVGVPKYTSSLLRRKYINIQPREKLRSHIYDLKRLCQ